jgi:uncharacterized FlaG/YvyC family protein
MSVPEIKAVQSFPAIAQPQLSTQSSEGGNTEVQLTGNTSNSGSGQSSGSGSNSVDTSNLQKGIEKLNQILASSQTKVEMAQDTPPNQIWLNVVDSTTGQVIERLPPEGLRQFMETHNAKGLAMDMRL